MPQGNIKSIRTKVSSKNLAEKVANVVNMGYSATIPLRGISMRPFIEGDRDKAVLVKTTSVKKQDVVFAFANGKYLIHRIVDIDGDKITLQGDGNTSTENCCRENILATVKGFYRKGRKKMESTDSTKWKLYSTIWVWLRPFRRYLLFIYRHVNSNN